MVEFVPLDLKVHKEAFVKLNVEFLTWVADQFRENFQLDVVSTIGQTVSEYVDAHLEDLVNMRPPDGIIFLLVDGGDAVGMGGTKRLSGDIGEIKRMYIRPLHRGKGYGKQLLNQLLKNGREFGFTSFLLETSKFMTAAQRIYRNAGFTEREEYPESETPAILRPYQMYMEKLI